MLYTLARLEPAVPMPNPERIAAGKRRLQQLAAHKRAQRLGVGVAAGVTPRAMRARA